MGFIHFGGSDYEFDDRTLAHVKVAITAKLRRQATFMVSWTRSPGEGSGRVALLLSPQAPLVFRFNSSTPHELNRAWVQALMRLAGTPTGMRIIPEEEAEHYAKPLAL